MEADYLSPLLKLSPLLSLSIQKKSIFGTFCFIFLAVKSTITLSVLFSAGRERILVPCFRSRRKNIDASLIF